MAAWRRIALELFPGLEREIRSPLETPYSLFADLLPLLHAAHRDGDINALQSVYGYAEWALRQPDNDLSNAAGVSFYEHLFDGPPRRWPDIVEWLSPYVAEQCSSLWELMLQPSRYAEVQQLIRERQEHRYPQVNEVWADVDRAAGPRA